MYQARILLGIRNPGLDRDQKTIEEGGIMCKNQIKRVSVEVIIRVQTIKVSLIQPVKNPLLNQKVCKNCSQLWIPNKLKIILLLVVILIVIIK